LLSGQEPSDRPDLCSTVFALKRAAILNDILKDGWLGQAVAYVYAIEFQKRGLPHCHLLIILEGNDKIFTAQQVDRLISAEIPDPALYPELHTIVAKHSSFKFVFN
jgi:hypothetical protein